MASVIVGATSMEVRTRLCAEQGRSRGVHARLRDRLGEGEHPGQCALLPGWIDTDLTRDAQREVVGLHERVLARTPAGRWGDAKDFAGIAVFLASAASDFVIDAAVLGVDIKQTDHGFIVMEVNDNPNLEHGIRSRVYPRSAI
jgi:hypothetical protein